MIFFFHVTHDSNSIVYLAKSFFLFFLQIEIRLKRDRIYTCLCHYCFILHSRVLYLFTVDDEILETVSLNCDILQFNRESFRRQGYVYL